MAHRPALPIAASARPIRLRPARLPMNERPSSSSSSRRLVTHGRAKPHSRHRSQTMRRAYLRSPAISSASREVDWGIIAASTIPNIVPQLGRRERAVVWGHRGLGRCLLLTHTALAVEGVGFRIRLPSSRVVCPWVSGSGEHRRHAPPLRASSLGRLAHGLDPAIPANPTGSALHMDLTQRASSLPLRVRIRLAPQHPAPSFRRAHAIGQSTPSAAFRRRVTAPSCRRPD